MIIKNLHIIDRITKRNQNSKISIPDLERNLLNFKFSWMKISKYNFNFKYCVYET